MKSKLFIAWSIGWVGVNVQLMYENIWLSSFGLIVLVYLRMFVWLSSILGGARLSLWEFGPPEDKWLSWIPRENWFQMDQRYVRIIECHRNLYRRSDTSSKFEAPWSFHKMKNSGNRWKWWIFFLMERLSCFGGDPFWAFTHRNQNKVWCLSDWNCGITCTHFLGVLSQLKNNIGKNLSSIILG